MNKINEYKLDENIAVIKNKVLKGRSHLPYKDYIRERAIVWIKDIATEEELEEARNQINYTLYELEEYKKSHPLGEKTASH